MPTAIQVADWIVRYRCDEIGSPVDPMELEKLVFYAQSFHLALKGEPLFADAVEAWRDGPVVRRVWETYNRFGAQRIMPADGFLPNLGEATESLLREVVAFFGRWNALQLSNATHAEEPWKEARVGYARRDPSHVVIQPEKLRSYYGNLIADGEEALSEHALLDTVPDPRWAWFYVAAICRRGMANHALYHWGLAKKLSEPVPPPPDMDEADFTPPTKAEALDRIELRIERGTSRETIRGKILELFGE